MRYSVRLRALLLLSVGALALLIAGSGVSAQTAPQTIIVDPDNDQGWLFSQPIYCTPATQPPGPPYDPCSVTGGGMPIDGLFELGTDTVSDAGFEVGPLAPPEGVGSYFAEITAGGSKVNAARNDYNEVSFAGLTGMEIATYLDPAATDNANWYVNLYIDQSGDGNYDCRLDGAVPNQAPGSWVTTDLYNLTWAGRTRDCNGFSGSLDDFTTLNPLAQLIFGFDIVGFPQIVISEGDTQDSYEGYVGNFDAFRIAHNDVGDITWDFEPLPADLAVTKSVALNNDVDSDGGYDPGDTIDYTVTVTNNGPSDTTGITIADVLPADLTLVTSNATQGSYDGSSSWTVGALTSSATATLTITATINGSTEGSEITNTASVSNNDLRDDTPDNDSDSAVFAVDTPQADLAVTKTVGFNNDADSDSGYDPGDTLAYTVTVTNNGPDSATGVEITDAIPSELTLNGAVTTQGTYTGSTWTINGSIDSGNSATLTLNVAINNGTEGTEVTNTASVSNSDVRDENADNNSASAVFTVDAADDGGDDGDDNDGSNDGDDNDGGDDGDDNDDNDGQQVAGTIPSITDTTAQRGSSSAALAGVEQLPATGETPWWRDWVLAALSVLGVSIGATGIVLNRRAAHEKN